MEETKIKQDVYAIVTQKIISQLEQGVVPWRQPWVGSGRPRNFVTKRPYRGINTILLNALHYEHNLFLTFHQAKKLGARIRKGEKAHWVVYYTWIEKERILKNGESETVNIPLLRYFNVFNVAQCEGITVEPEVLEEIVEKPIDACDTVIRNMPNAPQIYDTGSEAYYHTLLDVIYLPPKKKFVSVEEYYITLFHELIHSTGHHTRLNRVGVVQRTFFGSEPYSFEELVAEIGACFLASHTGIVVEDFRNNVAYLSSWLHRLKNDRKLIVKAATQAQRATDYILNNLAGIKEGEV